MLQGAEVLLYPTAIGSEPPNPTYNSYPHWARVMQGHAGANMVRRGLPCLFLRMWCLSFALPVWGGSVPVMHSPQAEGCRLGLLECACCASRSHLRRRSSLWWPPPQVPLVASNRIGREDFENSHINFYGGSFIAGPTGEVVAQVGADAGARPANGGVDPAPERAQGFVTASFDLEECRINRAG